MGPGPGGPAIGGGRDPIGIRGGNIAGDGPVGKACVGTPVVFGADRGGGAELTATPAPLISSSNLDISSAREAELPAAIVDVDLAYFSFAHFKLRTQKCG